MFDPQLVSDIHYRVGSSLCPQKRWTMSLIEEGIEYILCNWQSLVDLLEYNPAVRSYVNAWLINTAVAKAPFRPYTLSTLCDYSSWDSLTDRTYCGRHLPPVSLAEAQKLPDIEKDIKPLFKRPASGMRPCKKSTVLFSYFAQWFTDAFLRTTRLPPDGHYDPKLKNTSPHDIDLCNLYGLKWNVFGEPKNDVQYLRSMQGGTLESQEINGEVYPPYYYDANGQPKDEFKLLSMTDSLDVFIRTMGGRDPLDKNLFAMGGDRLNSQIGFAAMNTLFLREHNRICGLLRKVYQQWDDERLFQTARNINLGVLAKVVIEEYINHIAPLRFRLRLEPGRFERQRWYRTNWMTIEFSNIEALARGTHALSRAVEERRNSGFSPFFRMLINSNEPGPLPQAHGTLGSFFDNSLLPVGGGRPCRKTVTMIKAQTPKGTPAREQQCFGRCEHAARRFVQAPERDGIEPRGKPPGRASVTAPQHAGQSGPA